MRSQKKRMLSWNLCKTMNYPRLQDTHSEEDVWMGRGRNALHELHICLDGRDKSARHRARFAMLTPQAPSVSTHRSYYFVLLISKTEEKPLYARNET